MGDSQKNGRGLHGEENGRAGRAAPVFPEICWSFHSCPLSVLGEEMRSPCLVVNKEDEWIREGDMIGYFGCSVGEIRPNSLWIGFCQRRIRFFRFGNAERRLGGPNLKKRVSLSCTFRLGRRGCCSVFVWWSVAEKKTEDFSGRVRGSRISFFGRENQ